MRISVDGRDYDVQTRADAIVVDGEAFSTRVESRGNIHTVYVSDKPFHVELPPGEGPPSTVIVDAKEYRLSVAGQVTAAAPVAKPAATRRAVAAEGVITAPMTGRVVAVKVAVGDEVQEGDVLFILEAMKMENEIRAPTAGKVKEIPVAAGSRVNEGDLLVVLEPAK